MVELRKNRKLWGSGTCFVLGMERYGEAVRAFSEGLRLLAPFFQELPQAFGGLAGALKQLYLEACRKAGEEPDGDLLSRFD
jgi:hypothetical protein